MRGWVIACLLWVAVPARADCPHAGKVIPVTHGSVIVDGKLDDPTWASACFIDDFEQKEPAYGARPSYRVTAALAIDGDTLYVAA
ncbi:MAG TPA: hypothetical protein VHN14_30300, partial [Kofleriaceae bacterium]|nr:hypothetical protein [Kofleriaceae bacterium]